MELTPIMHILIVDNNRADTRLLQEVLHASALACKVSVVEDGEQALAFLGWKDPYTTATRPDLILLDLHIPKLDGRDVLQRLRVIPEWKTIPIMILAGLPQDVDYQYAAALQVERFLPKPVDWEEYQALGEDLATWWQIRASSPLCKKGGQSGDRERESPCVTVPRYPGAADD